MFPIDIISVPIVRTDFGLALSSRNQYLTEQQQRDIKLYQILCDTKARMEQGEKDFAKLNDEGLAALRDNGITPDYFTIRRQQDLQIAKPTDKQLIILAAGYLGKTRLLDNIKVSL